MTTVGSQDTTGPMTRDELKELACLGFSSDLVMQSFCHTAAYPKPVDEVTHRTLPDFLSTEGECLLDQVMALYILGLIECCYQIQLELAVIVILDFLLV